MKFSTKLTIVFSGIALFISTVIASVVYTFNTNVLDDYIKDRLRNQAFHTIYKIDRMLFERNANINVIASDPVIVSRHSTAKQIMERLQGFQKNFKQYDSISFFDLNRVRIADTKGLDIGKQHSLSGYWLELAKGKDSACEISDSESLKRPEFHFATVVQDTKRNPIGVIVARMPLEDIYDIAGQAVGIYNVKKDFNIELVDKNGLVIYSNTRDDVRLKHTSSHWDFIKKDIAAGLTNSAGKHIHNGEKEGDGIIVFAGEQGYKDFKGHGWTLIIEVPTKIVYAPVKKLRGRLMIILLLIGSVGCLIVFLFSRTVSRTIERLTAASNEISKGNLDASVAAISNGEIGRLVATFNKMAKDLKASRDRLLAYSHELAEKVEERTSRLKDINERLEELVRARTAQLEDSKEKLRSLSIHLETVREEERKKIAQDIHDDLGQMLTVLKMDAAWLDSRIQDAGLSGKIKAMMELTDATITAVKRICEDMRPPVLDYFGLEAAFEWQAGRFEQQTGISCEFTDGSGIFLSREKAIIAFRIFQEALTNIARHAEATRVVIRLTAENGKGVLIVRDNGKGITEEQISNPCSFGIMGMRERAYFLGGELKITGTQGKGTTIIMTFPVDSDKNA